MSDRVRETTHNAWTYVDDSDERRAYNLTQSAKSAVADENDVEFGDLRASKLPVGYSQSGKPVVVVIEAMSDEEV